MNILSVLCDLTSFGAAGLMGAMWLCERRMSRTREEQINAAHQRIARDEERLACLTDVVERNTAAIIGLSQLQQRQTHLLEELIQEKRHARR